MDVHDWSKLQNKFSVISYIGGVGQSSLGYGEFVFIVVNVSIPGGTVHFWEVALCKISNKFQMSQY